MHPSSVILEELIQRVAAASRIEKKKSTWAASTSWSCFWMSKERGCNMQTKNKSDLLKNELWLSL